MTERHSAYLVPGDEIERRLASLRAAMKARDFSLAWIEHLADRLYFTGTAQDGVLLVPHAGTPEFFVRKSLKRAEFESRVDVQPYPGWKSLTKRVRQAVGADGSVGMALDVTPASTFARLKSSLDRAAFVDLSATIRELRATKSPWEIEQIRKASAQVETLYQEAADLLEPGITELELTGRIEGRLRALGHGGTVRVRRPAADITMGVVVSGSSGLYPTSFNGPVGGEGPYPGTAAGAGWKLLALGESVMLDIVTSYNGYHADTTRTFFLGDTPPERAVDAHEFCRAVLERIVEQLKPGAVCSEIYEDARQFAEGRGAPQGFMGYAENRVRFFGHGVGLELDELPVLADRIDMRLAAGMVLAVEPKAFLEEIGPLGVENTYVVTERGADKLCSFDDALVMV